MVSETFIFIPDLCMLPTCCYAGWIQQVYHFMIFQGQDRWHKSISQGTMQIEVQFTAYNCSQK